VKRRGVFSATRGECFGTRVLEKRSQGKRASGQAGKGERFLMATPVNQKGRGGKLKAQYYRSSTKKKGLWASPDGASETEKTEEPVHQVLPILLAI